MMAITLSHTSSTSHLHCFWIQGTSHLHAALSNAFCLMSLGGATQRNILDQRASVHLDCVHLYICIFVYSVYHTHIGPMCTHRCKCTHRLDQLVHRDCALVEWVLCLRDAFQWHSLQLIAIAIGLSETRDCATTDQLSAQRNSLSTSVLWQMHSDSSD